MLLVEDEPRIASTICKYFELESYQYTALASGEQVVATIKEKQPDLCILDIMLPDVDGIRLCREIRTFSSLPIIFLTAKVEEVDRLIGFDAGADDYVCKPFSPKELMARIAVWLKRSTAAAPDDAQLVFDAIVMNIERFTVTVNEQAVKLTLNEFNILRALMEYPEKVFSRRELLYAVKQRELDIYERTIDSHIKNLRKKLAAASAENNYITSIYGVGYSLSVSV